MASQSLRLETPDKVSIQILRGSELPFTGQIRNLCKGAIQVLAPKVIEAGSLVRLEFSHDCTVTGEVLYCYPLDGSYCSLINFAVDPTRELRVQERFETQDEEALVGVMTCPTRCQLEARVTDASRTGIGLQLRRPLAVNDWVRVETGTCILFGDVKHCEPHSAGGYKAGILIESVILRSSAIPQAEERQVQSLRASRQRRTLLAALGEDDFDHLSTHQVARALDLLKHTSQ